MILSSEKGAPEALGEAALSYRSGDSIADLCHWVYLNEGPDLDIVAALFRLQIETRSR